MVPVPFCLPPVLGGVAGAVKGGRGDRSQSTEAGDFVLGIKSAGLGGSGIGARGRSIARPVAGGIERPGLAAARQAIGRRDGVGYAVAVGVGKGAARHRGQAIQAVIRSVGAVGMIQFAEG